MITHAAAIQLHWQRDQHDVSPNEVSNALQFGTMSALFTQSSLPDWDRIHTVLLDMDGTLLDLRFDNYFWLEYLPQHYGNVRGLTLQEAQQDLQPRFAAHQGTLQWYCTDHWSRELGLNIAALKHEAREHIRFLKGAQKFLTTVRQMGRRLILATNAHFDTLAIKAQHTGLEDYLDAVISSHSFGVPKEHPQFWPALEHHIRSHHDVFDRHECLFVDDSLPVLRAAKEFGIAQIFAIKQPDSTRPVREITEFPAVNSIFELLP
jgi:putative hydrolase of the HAD superfamily